MYEQLPFTFGEKPPEYTVSKIVHQNIWIVNMLLAINISLFGKVIIKASTANMILVLTYGELRKILKDKNSDWMPDEKYKDDETVPQCTLGGGGKPLPLKPGEKIDFKKVLADLPTNPFLVERRIEDGIVQPSNKNGTDV